MSQKKWVKILLFMIESSSKGYPIFTRWYINWCEKDNNTLTHFFLSTFNLSF